MDTRYVRWLKTIGTLGSPWILVILLWVLFFARSYFSIDPDFGWHISSGEYIINHGIPLHDIYTYTASDFPWIHHEWLADVIQAGVYHLSGYFGLALLHSLLWTGAFLIVLRRSGSKMRSVVLVAALAVATFAGVRALSWSVLLSALLIYLVGSKKRPLSIALIPFLMVLWANLHGSFVLGLAYLAWQALTKRSMEWVRVVLLAGIMTCVTPYGPFMYIEVFRTVSDASLSSHVKEWQSLSIGMEAILFVGIWIASLSVEKKTLIKKILRFDVFVFVAAMISSRHIALFVIYSLGGVLMRISRIMRHIKTIHPLPRPMMAAVAMITLSIVGYSVWTLVESVSLHPESRWPERIVTELTGNPCEGRLFNAYNIGGYLIWKLPGTPIYIDGRMPSWEHNGQKYMDTYLRVIRDDKFRVEEFKRYDVRCVIWQDNDDLTKTLKKEGWQLVIDDAGYSLLRKD